MHELSPALRDRFAPVEDARSHFLGTVKRMNDGSEPVDLDVLLQLANSLLRTHDHCASGPSTSAVSPTPQ